MEKKLDNANLDEEQLTETLDTPFTGFDEAEDQPEFSFDEDGNLIEPDYIEDDEEESTENQETTANLASESDEERVEETVDAKPFSKLSPAELKIVNQKKEMQKMKQQMAEMQAKIDEKTSAKEAEELQKKFLDEGWDEATSKTLSATEIRMKVLEQKIEASEFERSNRGILNKYPQAEDNIQTIMKNAKLTGMTVEQICTGLYGTTKQLPDYEQRVLDGAMGKPTREIPDKTSTAKRSSETTASTLSREDQKYKRTLESMFNGGKPLTNEEFNKINNR